VERRRHVPLAGNAGLWARARDAVPEEASPTAVRPASPVALRAAEAGGPVDGRIGVQARAPVGEGREIPGRPNAATSDAEPHVGGLPRQSEAPAVKDAARAAYARGQVRSAAATIVAGAALETTSAPSDRPRQGDGARPPLWHTQGVQIRFWGTRGSIPTPDRRTSYFGGNTSCVEVRAADDHVIILDCGTGARPLGLDILGRGEVLPPLHILITHTHWDHIQGFPFFLPAYVPGARLTFYGTRGLERTLEASISGQMHQTYFPVQLGELRAQVDFVELAEQRFALGSCRVTTQFLNHTAPTIGYRFERGHLKFAYVTDHEPFWWPPTGLSDAGSYLHPGDDRHIAFVEGVDLLIHDAQYSDHEYPAKRGWGHSPIEYVVDIAVRARVKRLVLFHHDPLHSDAWVRQHTEAARRRARALGSSLEIVAASEGLEIRLAEPVNPARIASNGAPRTAASARGSRILVAGSTGDAAREIRDALARDGYEITIASNGKVARVAAKQRPHLLILVGSKRETALLNTVRRVRGQAWGASLPILVLAGSEGPGVAGRLADRFTDVLTRPLNPAFLRPRVRAWLSRSGTAGPVGRGIHRQPDGPVPRR